MSSLPKSAESVDLANFLTPPKLIGRDDKLATLTMKVDEGKPHLKIVDQAVCLKCAEKPCTVTCPVENYRVEENGHTTIYWSNCIECGTCRIICPFHNIWGRYPSGGFGVTYRYG